MSLIVRCDTCRLTVPRNSKMPPGWRTAAEYQRRGTRRVFVKMKHACPDCPVDVARPMPDGLPVCTTEEALAEVEEAGRFAVMDEGELRGSARKVLVRALAILDAARARIVGG